MNQTNHPSRVIFLDYLRVFACLMVLVAHGTEYFYVDPATGAQLILPGNHWWVNLVDGFCRSSVPLFMMASSYLLLPLNVSNTVFFKKRFTRVLIPLVVWLVLYACLPYLWGEYTGAQVGRNLIRSTWNFGPKAYHLWYVYTLVGMYLFMPVLTPWLKQTSRRFLEFLLILWFVSTFYHYAKFGVRYVLGEAFWNEFHSLYYFSGYIGYVVLAYYIREYIHWSTAKSWLIGGAFLLVGYGATAGLYGAYMYTSTDMIFMETFWRFCTPNVALQTIGMFLIFRTFNTGGGWFYRWVQDMSKLSYGIYLMHIMILPFIYKYFHAFMSTPMCILCTGTTTFMLCYITMKLLSYIPKSKYITG